MHDDVRDLEEVVLFPELSALAAESGAETSRESQVSDGETALGALREWLTLQLAHVDGQMRKQSGASKPEGLTPDIAAYIQAREAHASRKAARDAYMKALHKLDYFAK